MVFENFINAYIINNIVLSGYVITEYVVSGSLDAKSYPQSCMLINEPNKLIN